MSPEIEIQKFDLHELPIKIEKECALCGQKIPRWRKRKNIRVFKGTFHFCCAVHRRDYVIEKPVKSLSAWVFRRLEHIWVKSDGMHFLISTKSGTAIYILKWEAAN